MNTLRNGLLNETLSDSLNDALIETAKLNGVDPQTWLADTIAGIPDYKITRVNDLLPWK